MTGERKPVSFKLKADDPTLLTNCVVEVDGRPVDITDVVITCLAGQESKVAITTYAMRGLDLELPADVQVTIVALPGLALNVTKAAGLVRYTVGPEPAAE